jgi:S-methylmethionine-dependent homocysteine/selenocysteine methylase
MTQITLLDGGMGQELVHRAGDRPTPLWSTQVMVDHPGMVAGVHRDFAAAGATVATANTYAIHHDRLDGTALEGKFGELHSLALIEARGFSRVAGSIGPLRGSYRADLMPTHNEAVAKFAEVARTLGPHVDLIICETVVSLAHTRAILEAAQYAGKPVWIAFSVSDEDGTVLRSGEALADAMALVGGAEAVMVNCSTPEVIIAALDVLVTFDKPYGAYANGFESITDGFLEENSTVDKLKMRRDFTPDLYADHAMRWVSHGATIIGGCCEVGPAHIAEIASRLSAAGHTII